MCISVTGFVVMLGNDDGRFLMDRETGEVRLTQAVKDRLTTPTSHLQVMVRLTNSYVGHIIGVKIPILLSLYHSLCVLQPGIPRQWPQEVLCCYSVGPCCGSEPVLPKVWHGCIQRLCKCRKEYHLPSHNLRQQSTDVTCTGPGLQGCMYCSIHPFSTLCICFIFWYPPPPFYSPQIGRASIPWSTSLSAPHPITQTSTRSHRRGFWLPWPMSSNQNRNTFLRWASVSGNICLSLMT